MQKGKIHRFRVVQLHLRRSESVQHSYRRGGACKPKGGVLNPALRLFNVIGIVLEDGGAAFSMLPTPLWSSSSHTRHSQSQPTSNSETAVLSM